MVRRSLTLKPAHSVPPLNHIEVSHHGALQSFMISKELVSFKFCFIIGFILLIHHATHNSILCYYCKQPTFDLVSFDLSYFLRQKAKKLQKVPFIFFRSPSLPCLFTLRPHASIWIFHILALITIFFLVMRLNADTIMYPNRKHFNFLLWKSK